VSVPIKKRKPDTIRATQTWLHIYSIVVEALATTVKDVDRIHNIAASAANAIIKEVDLGD